MDYFTNERIQGPCVKTITKGINEFPLYIKEGGILVCGEFKESSKEPLDKLILDIATPQSDMTTTARLYEDDGICKDYHDKNHRWTSIQLDRKNSKLALTVKATKGSFAGEVKERAYEIVFRNMQAVPKIEVNGQPLPAENAKIENGNLVIQLAPQSVKQDLKVVL